MAKQTGPLPLSGTIDDLTYSKGPFGNLVTKKTGPTRKQVLKDAAFERTRENAAEFKTAVAVATLIRRSIKPVLIGSTNVWLNGRMNRLILHAIRSDETHSRGKRNLTPGALSILKGFEINPENTITRKKGILCKTRKNTRKGTIQLMIAPFIPGSALTPPEGATHFQILSIRAVINVGKKTFTNDLQATPLLVISRRKTAALSFQHPVTAKAGEASLQAIGIVFYKMIDGLEKKLKGGAAKIVEA